MQSEISWQQMLIEAIYLNDLAMVRQAIASGADPNTPWIDEYSPSYPLTTAVLRRQSETIRVLLDYGARVDLDFESGPIHIAAEQGDATLVELLLAAESGEIAINQFDHLGRTPLQIAVELGWLPIVQLLLKRGASLNIYDENWASYTPLLAAVKKDSISLVKLLLAAHADPNFPDSYHSPLAECRRRKRGNAPLILELLEAAQK